MWGSKGEFGELCYVQGDLNCEGAKGSLVSCAKYRGILNCEFNYKFFKPKTLGIKKIKGGGKRGKKLNFIFILKRKFKQKTETTNKQNVTCIT